MGTPYMDASLIGRRGQPGRPSAGMSATKRICQPGYQAGRSLSLVLERPQSIPDAPGSYQFKDADGRIIYVGKARSLRSRLSSYFEDPRQLHPRTAQMVERAASVEWIQVVASDVEAIMLEYNLIKAHRPRFNVRLVDDKSYPYLAVTVGDEWPRAMVMRGAKRKGTRYFGPYAHAYAIRETLDLLLRSFPIRTCSDAKFRRHQRLGRPCLLFHIERCSGPCVGEVDHEEYARLVDELMAFLDGDTEAGRRPRSKPRWRQASDELEFELAARLRDRLESVRLASERQEMVADTPEDLDVVGDRRGRARGGGAGPSRPARPRRRAARLRPREGRAAHDRRARRAGARAALRRDAARDPPRGARPRAARGRGHLRDLARRASARARSRCIGAAAGPQARAARTAAPERRRAARAPPPAARRAT